ncbi:hypothetical protein [Sinomonas sp.]|uniref:hypothetical protein n=1 Tax=Sinomonas sp. TaxID=1914986 RepID=UPI002FE3E488
MSHPALGSMRKSPTPGAQELLDLLRLRGSGFEGDGDRPAHREAPHHGQGFPAADAHEAHERPRDVAFGVLRVEDECLGDRSVRGLRSTDEPAKSCGEVLQDVVDVD